MNFFPLFEIMIYYKYSKNDSWIQMPSIQDNLINENVKLESIYFLEMSNYITKNIMTAVIPKTTGITYIRIL